MHNTLALLRGNTALTFAVVLFIAVLCYFKPREGFGMVLFALFIIAVFYFITLLADTLSTGTNQKGEMIYKTRDSVGE